jgi:hypothetical protein
MPKSTPIDVSGHAHLVRHMTSAAIERVRSASGPGAVAVSANLRMRGRYRQHGTFEYRLKVRIVACWAHQHEDLTSKKASQGLDAFLCDFDSPPENPPITPWGDRITVASRIILRPLETSAFLTVSSPTTASATSAPNGIATFRTSKM